MSEKLAHYTFLPYVRLGLSANITESDHLGTGVGSSTERVTVSVEARVNGNRYDELKKKVLLVGPGDITGIQSKAIVRNFPLKGTQNFEPNYLAFIEFYEEDFLWRYTPAKASGDKLRPWLVLLILKDGEFERESSLTGPLPGVTLSSEGLGMAFPDVDESWAWAHVHANEDLDPSDSGKVSDAVSNLNDAVSSNPDSACSRLMSSRRLEPETHYTAFLVPAFETGRLAGLGEDTSTTEAQKASWGGESAPSRYPFYHSFDFRTGREGDFETLVEALVPRKMDDDVGKQPMDIQDPGYDIHYAQGDGTVKLEGALRIPDTDATVPLSFTGAAALANDIGDVLNLESALKSASYSAHSGANRSTEILQHDIFGVANPSHVDGDPVITPPLYGRWHAKVDELNNPLPTDLSGANWVHQLNLDPSLRAAAGMGAEVVRKNQESYMDECWGQLGEIMEANQKIREAQLAKEAGGALYRKHLSSQSDERLLSLSSRYQSRVLQDSETVWQKTVESSLPVAAQSDAFRRIVRPSGPVLKRIQPTATLSEHSELVAGLARRTIPFSIKKPISGFQNKVRTYKARYLFNYPTPRSVSSGVRFALTVPGEERTVSSNSEAISFKAAVNPFYRFFDSSKWPSEPAKPQMDTATGADAIRGKLDPTLSIPDRLTDIIRLGGAKPTFSGEKIDTIMACPKLFVPAYEPLAKISAEYMLPNLDLIPDDTISLLEVNQPFIEAYLAGMNHEMMRELLWREFPTDQRGTVFQYFWDGTDFSGEGMSEEERQSKQQDIREMHEWKTTSQMGENGPRSENGTEAKLVLVVRGELLRRYPNTVIYAAKAEWQKTERIVFGKKRLYTDRSLPRKLTDEVKMPMFTAQINSDITLIGFDLTADEAHGMREVTIGDKTTYRKNLPGWFFVLEERAGEIRFGLDEPETEPSGAPTSYQELNWGHVATPSGHIDIDNPDNMTTVSSEPVKWGLNSANMAYILYQDPVRVAVHAADMIPLNQD